MIYNMIKKKLFTTKIIEDTLKKLKHLSVDTDKSIAELTQEAMEDLLIKYENKKNK